MSDADRCAQCGAPRGQHTAGWYAVTGFGSFSVREPPDTDIYALGRAMREAQRETEPYALFMKTDGGQERFDAMRAAEAAFDKALDEPPVDLPPYGFNEPEPHVPQYPPGAAGEPPPYLKALTDPPATPPGDHTALIAEARAYEGAHNGDIILRLATALKAAEARAVEAERLMKAMQEALKECRDVLNSFGNAADGHVSLSIWRLYDTENVIKRADAALAAAPSPAKGEKP